VFRRRLNGLEFRMGRLRILRVEGTRVQRWVQVWGFVQILRQRRGIVSVGLGARVRLGFTDVERVGTLLGDLRKGARRLEGRVGGEGRGWLCARAEARGDDRLDERNRTERAGCEAVQKVGHAIST
jgi:hypothetical protein